MLNEIPETQRDGTRELIPAKSTLLEDFRDATRIQGTYVREKFNLKNNS